MQIQLSQIRTDGGTQPRAQLDGVTVSEYAEAMERGADFPPVKVMHDGENYWLYDGFHRVKAAQQIGCEQIDADVEQGTKEDAQWASLAANKRHGLRRSQADKRRAIKRALKGWGTDKSDREIARHVGCSQPTVSKYRGELEATDKIYQSERRTGADGRTIDTSNIGGHSGSSGSTRSGTERTGSIGEQSTPPEPDPMTTGAPSRRRRQSLRSRNSKMDALDLDDKEEPPTSEEVSQEIIRTIAKIRDSDGVQALRDFVDGQHQFTKEEKMRVKDAAQSLIDDLRNIHTQIK